MVLSDVSEEFGKLILENIEPLKKSIIELTGFLRGLNTAQKQLALKIAGITAVAGPLLIILGKVAKAVSTLVKLFMKLTPKGRILSLILTGLTLVFKPLKKAFESLTKTGEEFKNMVSTTGDVMETSPLFDTKNYAKVEKEVKKVTKSFAKFREVANISPIAAGPVSQSRSRCHLFCQLIYVEHYFKVLLHLLHKTSISCKLWSWRCLSSCG